MAVEYRISWEHLYIQILGSMALSKGAIEGIKKGDIANEAVTVKVSAIIRELHHDRSNCCC